MAYMTCREMRGNGAGIGMALYRLRLERTMQDPRQALPVLGAAAAGAMARDAAL